MQHHHCDIAISSAKLDSDIETSERLVAQKQRLTDVKRCVDSARDRSFVIVVTKAHATDVMSQGAAAAQLARRAIADRHALKRCCCDLLNA